MTGDKSYNPCGLSEEEKQSIVNTPITVGCFNSPSFNYDDFSEETLMNQELIRHELLTWNHELIPHLERLRTTYLEEKDERVFEMLTRLLPNSYKIVKLTNKEVSQWHVLRKNPEDLPEERKLVIIKIPGCYALGWHDSQNWYIDNLSRHVPKEFAIAWHELPKFGE